MAGIIIVTNFGFGSVYYFAQLEIKIIINLIIVLRSVVINNKSLVNSELNCYLNDAYMAR